MAKRKQQQDDDTPTQDASTPDAPPDRPFLVKSSAPAYDRAECVTCGATITYEHLTSGAAFTIVRTGGVEPDAVFGVGAHGRPMCPHGHGEMAPRDPPTPDQRALFDLEKPFNFEGAYLEVELLTVEVDRLAHVAAEDKKVAKASADAWASTATSLHTLTLELRRRRLEKRDRAVGAGELIDVEVPADEVPV
jgi:hypothetical protein